MSCRCSTFSFAGLGRADQDQGQLPPDEGRPRGKQGHLRRAHRVLPGDPHVSKRTHAQRKSRTHNTVFLSGNNRPARSMILSQNTHIFFVWAFSLSRCAIGRRVCPSICASNQSVIVVVSSCFLASAVFSGSVVGLHAVLFCDGAKDVYYYVEVVTSPTVPASLNLPRNIDIHIGTAKTTMTKEQ